MNTHFIDPREDKNGAGSVGRTRRRVMRIHFRRRRRAAPLVVTLLAAVGVAWFLFSPLLFDQVVDEPFPTATTQ